MLLAHISSICKLLASLWSNLVINVSLDGWKNAAAVVLVVKSIYAEPT